MSAADVEQLSPSGLEKRMTPRRRMWQGTIVETLRASWLRMTKIGRVFGRLLAFVDWNDSSKNFSQASRESDPSTSSYFRLSEGEGEHER